MPCRSFYIRESQFLSCINSCIVWLYYIVYLTISGLMYISLFPLGGEGAVTSNAIMNGFVYVSCTCMSISVGEILRRVIAGSKCAFWILIDLSKSPSQKAMLIYTLQCCTRVPIFPQLCQHKLLSIFVFFANLKGKKMVCHCFNLHFSDYYGN